MRPKSAPSSKNPNTRRALRLEPLEDRRMLAVGADFDFGDAPAPYPTTLADNGARHEAIGPTLGATRDAEPDGQPTATAAGDGNDDDGVTFDVIRVGQLGASATVNVQSAPNGARLDAWIDFNGDGNWGGSDEHIAAGVRLSNGDNKVGFDVPSGAISGEVYARFRISTAGDLGIGGVAADGEVEDYRFRIDPPAPASGSFLAREIGPGSADASLLNAADIDGDGAMDVISTLPDPRIIVWYRNLGGGDFTQRIVTRSAAEVSSIIVTDIDGDGDLDIVTASYASSYDDPAMTWYENDGTGDFTEHVIGTQFAGDAWLSSADMDGDGDIDLLRATAHTTLGVGANDPISWFENDGSENFTEHVIGRLSIGTSVAAADVDGDGDMDVLSTSTESSTENDYKGRISWFENNGSQNFLQHTLDTSVERPTPIGAADWDGDGDIDVLTSYWYENVDGNFIKRDRSSFPVADLDGDGDFDRLGASAAADMDGDGDLDLIGTLGRNGPLVWFENVAGDFGDAPAPYPTRQADGGAVHGALGPTLGATRDDEPDGRPSDAADGDGDDDGVTIGLMSAGQIDVRITVNVQSAPDGALLDAWIDFDGDGTWDGALEQIADSQRVSAGDNTLTFDVPSSALAGVTFARFRLSTSEELDPSGHAFDGEVEDYLVNILPRGPADFGDAPGSFATQVSQRGAVHYFGGPMLGATRDLEADGQPSVAADGDGADEDGVTFAPIFVGQVGAGVTVNVRSAPAGAKLDAWIDFNGDGFWDGWLEQIADGVLVTNGDNAILFDVPLNAVTVATYARFRLSTAGDLNSSGGASDGEVEDYLVTVFPFETTADFGDAPAPYPTLRSQRGAAHYAGGPMLGASRDLEGDGQPSAAADGDGAGDDGVSFGSIRVGQLDSSVIVNVQNAPAGARLDAWIDFNGDGNWGGAAERIATGVDVSDGDNRIEFDVPSTAISGEVYARFRVSTAGGLGVVGASADGEVEDYQLTIAPPLAAAGGFVASLIGTTADSPIAMFAADIDGDGDMDVLTASRFGDTFAWYENDGSGKFTQHTISSTADGAQSVLATDMDGDGDIDILTASADEHTIAWYENDGSQQFSEHKISDEARFVRSIFAADVDGDGDMDVLSAYSTISWHENDGNMKFTEHVVSNTVKYGWSVFAADMDGDGDIDVLSASSVDNTIAWYENDGSEEFVEHTISETADRARSVFAADIDGDGDLDVISASPGDDTVAWYENTGGEFSKHVITSTAIFVHSVFAADVDGDGDIDILSASSGDDTVAWYENDGDGNFTEHAISTSVRAPGSVFAADIDGDGDIDVLTTSLTDNTITWFENLSPPPPAADLTGNGFVDFEDLTWLLAHWNQNVRAAEGNLVDADTTPVNFEDLTVLLAAWTGPGPAGAPVGRGLAAVREAVGGDSVGDLGNTVAVGDASYGRDDEAPRQYGPATGVASYRGRRSALRSRPASGTYGIGRLQAGAVDRVLEVEGDEGVIRSRAFARRARGR